MKTIKVNFRKGEHSSLGLFTGSLNIIISLLKISMQKNKNNVLYLLP